MMQPSFNRKGVLCSGAGPQRFWCHGARVIAELLADDFLAVLAAALVHLCVLVSWMGSSL